MIAIVNVGPKTNDPGDERNYEVRINQDVVATFRHFRRDGLAVCLEKAAQAVREQDIVSLFEGLQLLDSEISQTKTKIS